MAVAKILEIFLIFSPLFLSIVSYTSFIAS